MAPINSESSLECFIPLNSRITCIFVERPAAASCRVHGRTRTSSKSRRGHSPKPKGTSRLEMRWKGASTPGVLAAFARPDLERSDEKPGKMAGLIESINWTNVETTKLNNAQWRWLGRTAQSPGDDQNKHKRAAPSVQNCSHLLFKSPWNLNLGPVPGCLYFSRLVTVKPFRQGTFGVAEYRAYIVGDDDHFLGFEEMVCQDDGEAVTKAKQLLDGRDVEVWNGDRLVIRLCHKAK